MSVLLIKWHSMYCLVGSCVLQSILSLKVSNYLNHGTVSNHGVQCGYSFCTRRCCPARVANISASALGNLYLHEEISLLEEIWQTHRTDLGVKGREGSDWRQEVGAGPAGAQLIHWFQWQQLHLPGPVLELEEQTPSPRVSAEQCVNG